MYCPDSLVELVKLYIFGIILPCYTEIGKKTWLFAKLQPGRARKKINAT